jgi:RNA polymerase sigma-70 factor (ECF subfamily)
MRVDQSVIEACKLDDAKAQKIVYERFAPMMLGVCMRYTRTREEAEDIMQEGFLTVFTKIDQFADKGSFEGWVRRIMVNAALMHFRKFNDLQNATTFGEEARISSIPDEAGEEVDEANLSVKDRIQHADFSRDELLEVIQELPDGFRMVFNLSVFEDYKHKEIADMLGIAEATSKTQLLRARKLIQKKLFEKALIKDKKIKPEKALALLALIMSDELKYIDELFQQGLGDLHVTPAAGWSSVSDKLADNQLSQSALSSSSQTTAGLQSGAKGLTSLTSKISHFIAGHVQTAIIASVASVVGVTAIVATVINNPTPELPATTPAIEQAAPVSQPELIQEEALKTAQPEQEAIPESGSASSESAKSPETTSTRYDSTVYDTVKVIIHEQVVVPKQIRKTIQQKKVIQQPADQL